MNINEAHSVAIRQMCRDQRPRPNNRPTHMLPSLNAAEKRRHDRTITCRGGRKITRCSCPDCVPSKESPPAAPAGPPPPADSGRLLSIVKKRITLSDFGPRHSALLFNVPPPQTGRTEIKRRMMTTAEKREKRTKGWTQESRILSDRHLSIREGPKKQIPSARRPRRVERQPPAGGTDESGNNMPTHY